MAKKKQRGFKMFEPGGPLVIPQSAKPSYMAPATNLNQAPTPNIAQPKQGAQAPAIGLSSIGGVLQGVTGLYQTMDGNLSVPKIQEQDFTAGSKQELLSKATDFKGYEMPKTDAVSSSLGGAAAGAAAGTAIAPGIGTVIGAGAGLVGGVASSIFGNSKRKRAKRRAERAAINNINAQNTELTEDSIYSSLSSQLAGGGGLYDDTSRENRGEYTAQTDNTYVEKPRIEGPVEQSVKGVKWSDLDFRAQMMNRGNLVNGTIKYQNPSSGIKYMGGYDKKGNMVLPVTNENGMNNVTLPEVTVTPRNIDLVGAVDRGKREFLKTAGELATPVLAGSGIVGLGYGLATATIPTLISLGTSYVGTKVGKFIDDKTDNNTNYETIGGLIGGAIGGLGANMTPRFTGTVGRRLNLNTKARNPVNSSAENIIPHGAERARNTGNTGRLLNIVKKATNTPRKLQAIYYNKAPWTFKPNPNSYYRTIPRAAIDDAIKTGVIRHKPESSKFLDLLELKNSPDPVVASKAAEEFSKLSMIERLNVGSRSRTGQTYFLKGIPWTQKYSRRYGKPDAGTYGDYFIEASDNVPFIPLKTKGRVPTEVMENLEKNYNPEIKGLAIPKANVLPEKVIPLDENVKLYKPDWLRGFKEIKTRKYQSGGSSKSQVVKGQSGSLAHSGDFSNGVTLFENGGTHEENPFGGIPQGYNENGELNLVEQGETKWKDYIFSDRNKLSKAQRFGLPGMLNNRTFSSAAKTIQKESEERPLDSISKRGLNKQMDYLISAQEEHNAMLENTNQFKSGGQMNFKSNKRVPGSQGVSMNGNPKTVKHGYGDWLRYAPVASNVIGLASDIASTPETIRTSKIEAPLLTEKMSYDPIDQEYLTNKLTSNYSNLVDKIQGSSGGNRGVSNASMIAAMNNLYDAYGDIAIKSKGYNRDMLSKTLEFNRATSQANAQMQMTADQYNANAEDRMIATNAANRAARRNAIREQIAGLGENLGAIGTEQRWMGLAPKLFRGYTSTADYIQNKFKSKLNNSVLNKSDLTSPSAIAKSTDLAQVPTPNISKQFSDLVTNLPAKAWSKRNRKTKEVKNG